VDPWLAGVGDARSLLLIADSLVCLVPLDALPDEKGDLLGERFDLVQIPALLELPPARATSEARLVAVGGVDYGHLREERSSPALVGPGTLRSVLGSTLAPLPATLAEAEALCDQASAGGLEAVLLSGADASRGLLFEAASGARYLHLATHGWFLEPREEEDRTVERFAPMLMCGLALAGADRGLAGERDLFGRVPGLLTAEELCDLDLSSCELAVLSACETNVGYLSAGQGIQSLQAALHLAGARMALTSLWKVDDAATAEWMGRFYEGLLREGLPAPEALRRARRALAAAGRPPRDWAAWVLSQAGL
jgi:CHAT domain-containing protein